MRKRLFSVVAVAVFVVSPLTASAGNDGDESGGTLTAFTKAKVCPFPSTVPTFAEGPWNFVSGTGGYAGIRGHGKLVATIEFSTGEVTIARTGEASRKDDD